MNAFLIMFDATFFAMFFFIRNSFEGRPTKNEEDVKSKFETDFPTDSSPRELLD